MFAEDQDLSELMFDLGPKHSTPIKGRADVGSRQRGESPELPSHSAAQHKPCYSEGSKNPGSMPPNGKREARMHADAARLSNSGPSFVGTNDSTPEMASSNSVDSLIDQQRKEITLLVTELKERDVELNEVVQSHQHQLSVWEQDRQLILRLQHKCQRLAAELKRKEKPAKNTRQTGDCSGSHAMLQSQSEVIHQNRSQNFNDSVKEASQIKGHSQTRDQELITLLQLKDQKLSESEKSVEDLRCQVKLLQMEREDQHSDLQHTALFWQQKCLALQADKEKLVGACQEKDRQLQQATTQLQDTLQQALVLQQALTISCEREKSKEELLNSVKARQERLVLELNQMRNLYKRQNREMTLMQLSLDTSKESDPDVGDNKTNSSLNGAHSQGFAGVAEHHNPTSSENPVKRVSAGSVGRHKSSRTYRVGASNDSDTSSDYHTPCAVQCSVSEPRYYGRNVKGAKSRGHTRSMTNTYSSHRGVADCFQEYNTNNNHENVVDDDGGTHLECVRNVGTDNRNANNSNCLSSAPHSSSPRPVHDSAHALVEERDSSSHLSAPSSPNVSPDNNNDDDDDGDDDDGANRAPDVDTEAFWQKILSVRHGNQNDDQQTKDSPLKTWIAENNAEHKMVGDSHIDPSAHQSRTSRERYSEEVKLSNSEPTKNGDAGILASSNLVVRDPNSDFRERPNIPASLFATHDLQKLARVPHNWLSRQLKESSKESLDESSHYALLQPQVRLDQSENTEIFEQLGQVPQLHPQDRSKGQTAEALMQQGFYAHPSQSQPQNRLEEGHAAEPVTHPSHYALSQSQPQNRLEEGNTAEPFTHPSHYALSQSQPQNRLEEGNTAEPFTHPRHFALSQSQPQNRSEEGHTAEPFTHYAPMSQSQQQDGSEGAQSAETFLQPTHHGSRQNLSSQVVKMGDDDGQMWMVRGGSVCPSHGAATTPPRAAQPLLAPFDEKLSFFLESPEDNANLDLPGSQSCSSPASKLHRLLLESQDMIRALEARPTPEQL